MKIKIIRGIDRNVYCASITLTDEERAVLTTFNAIPMMYAPGGMGPDLPKEGSNIISFGFVRHSDAERGELELRSCLYQFRTAMAAAVKWRRNQLRLSVSALAAWDAGFAAFPSGQFMDAMRGTKSYPAEVRCPYRNTVKAIHWNDGYSAAATACADAWRGNLSHA